MAVCSLIMVLPLLRPSEGREAVQCFSSLGSQRIRAVGVVGSCNQNLKKQNRMGNIRVQVARISTTRRLVWVLHVHVHVCKWAVIEDVFLTVG